MRPLELYTLHLIRRRLGMTIVEGVFPKKYPSLSSMGSEYNGYADSYPARFDVELVAPASKGEYLMEIARRALVVRWWNAIK